MKNNKPNKELESLKTFLSAVGVVVVIGAILVLTVAEKMYFVKNGVNV